MVQSIFEKKTFQKFLHISINILLLELVNKIVFCSVLFCFQVLPEIYVKIVHRRQVHILLQKSYGREEKPTLKSKVVGTILKLHI